MAQFYTKTGGHSKSAFDSTQIFLTKTEVESLSGTTYLGILNVFRKVLKGLNINELIS